MSAKRNHSALQKFLEIKIFCLSAFSCPSCDYNFEGQWLIIMSCFFIKSVKIIWIDRKRHRLSYVPRPARDWVKVVFGYFKSWSQSQYIGFCVRKINGKDLRSLAHLQFVQIEKLKIFFQIFKINLYETQLKSHLFQAPQNELFMLCT